MNKAPDSILFLLKEEVQNKFGKKIVYDNDCQDLLKQIHVGTHRLLSVSTLKRFFGIVKYSSSPSNYTLDSLTQFIGFDDWNDFINRFEKENHPYSQEQSWANLKERTNIITNTSLKSIKNKIGTRYEYFPVRGFAESKFEEFLNSPKIATALIAPNGYGKSTIVAQLTDKFFTGVDALYPNDIVCLIDGSIFYNLLTNHKKINRLYNLIDYDLQKSFSAVFREHPDLVQGRFVLIIDGIDDIYVGNEEIDHFVANLLIMISSYANIEWFKLLVTCSPNKWRMFSYRLQNNPMLKSFWFNVLFQGTDHEFINIPLFNRSEIKEILKKNHFDQTLEELCFNHPDILDLISNPYELHLFLSTYHKNGTLLDIDLLNQYINNTVLSSPYSSEKFFIVKSFFTLCGYGKNSAEVKKEDLKLSSFTIIAYNELIHKGILYEYTIPDTYLTLITYVRFTQNILFAYYLVNILINEKGLDIEFLRSIIADYNNNPHLQCNLLKYAIKILFKEGQVELLKNIFTIIEKEKLPKDLTYNYMPYYVLTNVLGVELRKNKQVREMLIPYFAQSEAGRTLFFERFFDIDSLLLHSGDDLDFYLQYNQSNEAKQYVCYMRFMKHFLSGNQELCKNEYVKCIALTFPEVKNSLNSSYFFIPQIIYESVYEKKVDENMIKEVYTMSDMLLQKSIQNKNDIPLFEFAIIFSFNYGKMNKEIIDLAHYIFENYDVSNLKLSCFYQFFLLVYAKALMEIGETKKAFEFYNCVKLENINIPEHLRNYFRIRFLLIMSEFQIKLGETVKARGLLEEIKTLSNMLNSSYFYECATAIEKEIIA